jgi:RNA polymerase sigma-70 factor (ECF subfamily)
MDEGTPDQAEARLLQQLRSGDRQAFEQLCEQHRSYLHQFIELRMDPRLRPRVDPSDVVQEAHLEAVRRLADYVRLSPMPFRLWLRQLAHDRLIMLCRQHLKAARRAVRREVALTDHSSLNLAQQLLGNYPSPSQQASREELAEQVRRAVAQLSELDQEILLMRTFEGLSFQEVGYLLSIEPAAARKRHGRALLRLHKILSEGGMTEGEL